MSYRVMECTTYDTASATCTASAWVEHSNFPALSTGDALVLLSAIAGLFVVAWGWKFLARHTRIG